MVGHLLRPDIAYFIQDGVSGDHLKDSTIATPERDGLSECKRPTRLYVDQVTGQSAGERHVPCGA